MWVELPDRLIVDHPRISFLCGEGGDLDQIWVNTPCPVQVFLQVEVANLNKVGEPVPSGEKR